MGPEGEQHVREQDWESMDVSHKSLLVARTRNHKPKQIETIRRRSVYVCVT